MKEILLSIIDAEKRGEEMVKEANVKAKELLLAAEEEKENLKKSAEMQVKQKNSAIMKSEEKNAQIKYNEIISEGTALAGEYKKSKKSEQDSIKTIIIGRFLEKYGAR